MLFNITTSYFMGVLILGYFNNGLSLDQSKQEEPDLEKQKEIDSSETMSKRNVAIIQKRNAFGFVILFNIVCIGGMIKPYAFLHDYFDETIDKFLIDGTIYFLTMSSAYLLL